MSQLGEEKETIYVVPLSLPAPLRREKATPEPIFVPVREEPVKEPVRV